MKPFAGLFTPIVTPFRNDDTFDEGALRQNVAQWLETCLTGLVVLGSNGEAAQLSDAECDQIVDVVRDAVPRGRPLIAGTGRESTRGTIAATRRAAQAGVDAALVRTPSFFTSQMTAEVFVRHYTEVADASPIPVLLYNVSMFTGVNLPPEAVERLSQHQNIVGLKESGSDISLITEYVTRTPDDFTVLAGSATTFFQAVCAGCDGAILALAALLPDACMEIMQLVADSRIERARALQQRITPLAKSVGGSYGVPGLKAALNLVGYQGGLPRPPLRSAPPAVIDVIRGQLESLGVIKGAHAPSLN